MGNIDKNLQRNNVTWEVVNEGFCISYFATFKAAKYRIQKPSTCRATLFRCKFSLMFPVFHLA